MLLSVLSGCALGTADLQRRCVNSRERALLPVGQVAVWAGNCRRVMERPRTARIRYRHYWRAQLAAVVHLSPAQDTLTVLQLQGATGLDVRKYTC